eukprot:GEMP01102799.1.p1 GENE.GEMP01102799.1~~GEMP01102799.1.p1  ORF type:complete len:133 (+),score=14.38 GEMP01102799.1:199-597(+)
MQTLTLQSHGTDADYKSPENSKERKKERDSTAHPAPPFLLAGTHGKADNNSKPQAENKNAEMKNASKGKKKRKTERKDNNKKINHMEKGDKARDKTLMNKPALKTLNIITINPDSLSKNDILQETTQRRTKN